ncbi:MAG TPA: RdgB/HAM1 family non-canonical purine NTP pyrophosphatase [Thiotrichales bacterium]|nr:RdgB/HAM1 family non-canonical purine NTP pyrophosphatase [Thiotrichales bacterium]
MNHRVVLASNNPGKLREMTQILSDLDIEVVPQSAFGIDEVEETGLSFVENALIKARHAAEVSGLPAIADDSGIEVDALQGRPGIYSARYAGPGATDADNNAKLLEELEGVPEPRRTARYQAVIVHLRHPADPTPIICSGTWEGRILTAPRGEHGFGYDPLFWVPTHGCASAELDPAEKNRISHRAQALACLKQALAERESAGRL